MQTSVLVAATMSSTTTGKKNESQMEYDPKSKKQFVSYFKKPPAKRGRPKKKQSKAGRPRKQQTEKRPKQTMMSESGMSPEVIDLTPKSTEDLDARLEAELQRLLAEKTTRVNWDKSPNLELRERIARSWKTKTDLWIQGESFSKFCRRTGISRAVLNRYLNQKQKEDEDCASKKGRGRPTLLSESVMRHLCEGM